MNHSSKKDLIGRVHSIESMGTLDGPGLRTVVFMQGCPLRCKFCHNVDLAPSEGGREFTLEELFQKVIKYKEYWDNYDSNLGEVSGGVTISGGEPTFQAGFVLEFLQKLRKENIHTAVDTCLFTSQMVIDKFLPYVNYWMISVKEMYEDRHKRLTSVSNEKIQENIRYVDNEITNKGIGAKIRVRFVVIPSLTDQEDTIQKLGIFTSNLKNLDCVELLPYTSLGKHKWIENFGSYPLEGIADASKEDIEKVAEVLRGYGVELKY